MSRGRCPDCGSATAGQGDRCRSCGARNRHAQGNGVKRQPGHMWNRQRKVLPGVADGSGCMHHFVIPTQPEEPVGTCQKCGLERLHSNAGTGFEKVESPWRMWSIGRDPLRDELSYRLPPGYHLTGPAE